MPTMEFTVLGEDLVAADFRAMGLAAQPAVNAVTTHYAEVLKLAIQAAAPVETGQYRDSWYIEFVMVGDVLLASVQTDEPYANRLEFGFIGLDSLGRSFNQPPQPHVGPATTMVQSDYDSAILMGLML